ncbi:MAG TPA: YegS/Rv2252/BmrU family lipid kinase [Longimicrobiaceae bacterium]
MRIDLVINPSSPDAVEAIREAVGELRAAGHVVHPRITFEKGDAGRFALEAARGGAGLVIAAGGDGTLNEVGGGLHAFLEERARSGGAGPEPPRMGIVPLGTANDLAGALEIPAEVGAAVQVAVEGRPHALDVGLLNGAAFLNVSTGGFGAEATEETSDEVKRMLGPLAYFITGVKKFVALATSTASFSDGETLYEGPFLIFAVGNSRRTGGGNWLTPRADLADGLLDVCIVKEIPRRDLLGLLPDLRAGRHLDHPAVVYKQVRELRVESKEELSVNVDGEPLGGRSLHYTISPHRLVLSLP